MEQGDVSILIAGAAHLPGGGAVRVHRAFSEPPCVPRLTDVPGPPLHTGRTPFPHTPPCTQCVPARSTGKHLFRGGSVFSPMWQHPCISAQSDFETRIVITFAVAVRIASFSKMPIKVCDTCELPYTPCKGSTSLVIVRGITRQCRLAIP